MFYCVLLCIYVFYELFLIYQVQITHFLGPHRSREVDKRQLFLQKPQTSFSLHTPGGGSQKKTLLHLNNQNLNQLPPCFLRQCMAAQATNHRTGHAEIISAFCLALLAKVGAKGIHCLVVIIWIFLTVQAFLEPDVCQSSSKQNVCPKPAPPLPGHQNQRLEFLFPISLSLPKAGQSSPKRSIVNLEDVMPVQKKIHPG